MKKQDVIELREKLISAMVSRLPEITEAVFRDFLQERGLGELEPSTATLDILPTFASTAKIWRINLKPSGGIGVPEASRKFCFDNKLVGVGWGIEDWINRQSPITWKEYQDAARNEYNDTSWIPALPYLHDGMNIDDLCWTRSGLGEGTKFWLGRIAGEWSYLTSKDAYDADIINVRPCEWVCVGGYNSVRAEIPNLFTPRVLQPVTSTVVKDYSKDLYNKLTRHNVYS